MYVIAAHINLGGGGGIAYPFARKSFLGGGGGVAVRCDFLFAA